MLPSFSSADSDQDLLAAFAGGDQTALDCLFQRYYPRLLQFVRFKLCAGLASKVDPEDVVQEIFLDVANRRAELARQGIAAFRPWLFKIARDKCAQAVRRFFMVQGRDVTLEVPLGSPTGDSSAIALADQLAAQLTSPSSQASRKEMIALMNAALEKLSEEHREVLLLRYFVGWSNDEIADYLGITKGGASNLYARAFKKLHKAFQGLLGRSG